MPYDFDVPHASGELHNGAGVQPWSSPEQYVIFSIDDPTEERDHEFEANCLDHDIGFKRLEGCYKGVTEPAWIINARDWRALAASGWIDGQESVLHLGAWADGGRRATLLSNSGERIGPVGTFRQASKAYALKQEAWTRDPQSNEYFVAE